MSKAFAAYEAWAAKQIIKEKLKAPITVDTVRVCVKCGFSKTASHFTKIRNIYRSRTTTLIAKPYYYLNKCKQCVIDKDKIRRGLR